MLLCVSTQFVKLRCCSNRIRALASFTWTVSLLPWVDVKLLAKLPNVHISKAGVCQYGMVGEQYGEEWPLRKPTR